MNNGLALVALAFLLGFLGILLWHLPRLDLGLLVAATLGLMVWDMIRSMKQGKN
jgi:hypothetical protein